MDANAYLSTTHRGVIEVRGRLSPTELKAAVVERMRELKYNLTLEDDGPIYVREVPVPNAIPQGPSHRAKTFVEFKLMKDCVHVPELNDHGDPNVQELVDAMCGGARRMRGFGLQGTAADDVASSSSDEDSYNSNEADRKHNDTVRPSSSYAISSR